MSKYSTEVRFICESLAGYNESQSLSKIDEVISKAIPKVFDFNFPIFDENYRNVLCTKILKHYYTREIGAETVGLWKHWLNTRLNEIMPYYNKLYKSELIEFNPMYDMETTREHSGAKDGTKTDTGMVTNNLVGTSSTTNTDETSNNHWDYYSDTPQGGVTGVENREYLTTARNVTDSGMGSGSTDSEHETTNTGSSSYESKIKDTETYTETVKGKVGGKSYAKMLEEFRQTFLNIDVKVINELSDLFMGLW